MTKQTDSRSLGFSPAKCLVLMASLAMVFSATTLASADAPDWENEQVIGINKLPPRATSLPFADRESAIPGDATNSPFFQSLNGQ